jgi:hypothetical protein
MLSEMLSIYAAIHDGSGAVGPKETGVPRAGECRVNEFLERRLRTATPTMTRNHLVEPWETHRSVHVIRHLNSELCEIVGIRSHISISASGAVAEFSFSSRF